MNVKQQAEAKQSLHDKAINQKICKVKAKYIKELAAAP